MCKGVLTMQRNSKSQNPNPKQTPIPNIKILNMVLSGSFGF
jgi:hypothetical protein